MHLTQDQIDKAFQRVLEEFSFPGAELVLVTEPYYKQALEFIEKNYLAFEPISKALEVPWDDQQEAYFSSLLKQHLTIMLIEKSSGETIAIRSTRIMHKDKKTDVDAIKNKQFRDFFLYVIHCDEQADFFGHFGIDETFYFNGLAVRKDYQRRGIAEKIFRAAVFMIRNLGLPSAYIKGEASSNYSRRIYEKCGFTLLSDQPYEAFKLNGKVVITNTGQDKSMSLYGIEVV